MRVIAMALGAILALGWVAGEGAPTGWPGPAMEPAAVMAGNLADGEAPKYSALEPRGEVAERNLQNMVDVGLNVPGHNPRRGSGVMDVDAVGSVPWAVNRASREGPHVDVAFNLIGPGRGGWRPSRAAG